MDIDSKGLALAEYTRSLSDFVIQTEIDKYDHMGALIVDAVLQAGIHYDTVVKPRVLKVQNEFPTAKTTTGFLRVLSLHGSEEILNFHGDKPMRVMEVASFLRYERLETVQELAIWLEVKGNREKIMGIKGIKDKTVDYMEILAGGETNAIDRHLLNFLQAANIPFAGYEDAQTIVTRAAQLLGVSVAHYDHSIWTYMSQSKTDQSASWCSKDE